MKAVFRKIARQFSVMRIIGFLFFASWAGLGVVCYLVWPNRELLEKNAFDMLSFFRGVCFKIDRGLEAGKLGRIAGDAHGGYVAFPFGQTNPLAEGGTATKVAISVVSCRMGYDGFTFVTSSSMPGAPAKLKISAPLQKPLELDLENGEGDLVSERLSAVLRSPPQRIELSAKGPVRLHLKSGDPNVLYVMEGTLELNPTFLTESGGTLGRALAIETSETAEVYLRDAQVLKPLQSGLLLPSGITDVKNRVAPVVPAAAPPPAIPVAPPPKAPAKPGKKKKP